MEAFIVLITAYLLGSLPTAVWLSHMLGQGDIRHLGDGNMGARNAARVLGWKAGAVVAGVDFSKGAVAVALSRVVNQEPSLQLAAGAAAVLGHDFPVWAGFRGGQGMPTSLGVLAMLMPESTLAGLLVFGGAFLVIRHFDLSAAIGLGLLVVLAWREGAPLSWVGYAIFLLLTIPAKKLLDLPRRRGLANLRRTRG